LTNDTVNHLKAIQELNDDFLTSFCFTVRGGVTDLRLLKTLKQVIVSAKAEEWKKAEEDELRSMRVNNVIKPAKPPDGVVPLNTKWVYTVKTDVDGNVPKYKARLGAKGYLQVMGIDYDETFSPVTRLETVRLILAIAAQLCLKIHQKDVKTAFLIADLDETEYI